MYLARVFTKHFSSIDNASDLSDLSTKVLNDLITSNGDYSFYGGKYPNPDQDETNLNIVALLLAKNTDKWMGTINLLFCEENELSSIKRAVPDSDYGPLGTLHFNIEKVSMKELVSLLELFLRNKNRVYRVDFKKISKFFAGLSDEKWGDLFKDVPDDSKKRNAETILNKYFRDTEPPEYLQNILQR